MEKYLISRCSKFMAEIEAHERGLKKDEWVYVPFGRGRADVLIGRRVSRDKIIGNFTDIEIMMITR